MDNLLTGIATGFSATFGGDLPEQGKGRALIERMASDFAAHPAIRTQPARLDALMQAAHVNTEGMA